jgi:tricorn protease
MSASLWNGRIVYQLGADIHLYEIASNTDKLVSITLDSDLDQTRERWIKRPMEYMSAAHISPDGDRVVLTARGRVFVAPHKQGRFVEVTRKEGVRYRNARFLPDGKNLVALSDESGEVELWKLPANGIGPLSQLTADGQVLRWGMMPSPDGKWIAHHDKDNRLFLYDVARAKSARIDQSEFDGFDDLTWSADSAYLAYVASAENQFKVIRIYSVDQQKAYTITTDRYDSYSPAFSPDGKWLYFLSDRNLRTIVDSPWGSYQPEPFFDKKTQVFAIALQKTITRSPFTPKDELEGETQAPAATRPMVSRADARPPPAQARTPYVAW